MAHGTLLILICRASEPAKGDLMNQAVYARTCTYADVCAYVYVRDVYVRNEPAGPALSVARERDGGIGNEGSATCTTPPTDSHRTSTNASRPIPSHATTNETNSGHKQKQLCGGGHCCAGQRWNEIDRNSEVRARRLARFFVLRCVAPRWPKAKRAPGASTNE